MRFVWLCREATEATRKLLQFKLQLGSLEAMKGGELAGVFPDFVRQFAVQGFEAAEDFVEAGEAAVGFEAGVVEGGAVDDGVVLESASWRMQPMTDAAMSSFFCSRQAVRRACSL